MKASSPFVSFSLVAATSAAALAGWLAVASATGPTGSPNTKGADETAASPAAAAPGNAALAAERTYKTALDKILEPVRELPVGEADAKLLRETFKAVGKGDAAAGTRAIGELTDPLAKKLVEWHLLRSGFGTAAAMREFLGANPDWPDRRQITQRMEEALFVHGGSAKEIVAFFGRVSPRTGLGWAALASAHMIAGNEVEARKLAAKVWREHDIPSLLETGFKARFAKLLGEADHKARFDRLTIADPRWTKDRTLLLQPATRVAADLTGLERKKALARIAALARSSTAAGLLAAIGEAEGKDDLGLVFHRAQVARRAGRNDEARRLLLAAHRDPARLINRDAWWEERHKVAYALLQAGANKSAYELVVTPASLTVNPAKEQAFMAGWIALRGLNDAKSAALHFAAMRKAADGPLSRAKAAYWQARTAIAAGDEATAKSHYEDAAKNFDTFYGQLAHAMLEKDGRYNAKPPNMPSEAQARRVVGSDAVKAVVYAHKAGLGREVTRSFLHQFRFGFESEAELALAAHVADAIDDVQMSVRIGKTAIARGMNLAYYAYPLHAFPRFDPLRPSPEHALLLAITRQESEFDTSIVSGAGARGLMQVMPITARHVCKDYRVKCDIGRLMTDRGYNAMMGSAYIGDRMKEFDGSYVLTIAGYNAGPGRVRQWMKAFGDPRVSGSDPLDWIHRIPFDETREYVQKVLSNLQIYRARLSGSVQSAEIIADLARGRSRRAAAPSTAPVPGSDTPAAASKTKAPAAGPAAAFVAEQP